MPLTVADRRGVDVAREVFVIPGTPAATPVSGDPLAALSRAAAEIGLPEACRLLQPLAMVLALNVEGGSTGPAGRQLANEIVVQAGAAESSVVWRVFRPAAPRVDITPGVTSSPGAWGRRCRA